MQSQLMVHRLNVIIECIYLIPFIACSNYLLYCKSFLYNKIQTTITSVFEKIKFLVYRKPFKTKSAQCVDPCRDR